MIVLDASAWVDILTAGVRVRSLDDNVAAVPPHFDAEVLGAIRALHQRGELGASTADAVVDRHLGYDFDRIHDRADIRRAWDLREALSFNDAWYVALAERLGAVWITADQRAARTARTLDVEVLLV